VSAVAVRARRAAVLAVDGGNSKTHAVLLDARGAVLGAGRSGGSSHEPVGVGGALEPVTSAARAACVEAGIDPDAGPVATVGSYCLAGVDLPLDARRITRAVRRTGLSLVDLVQNDTFAVLRAGTDRGWGIAVACGAGMNCVGVAPDGRTLRFPALGAISGDRGGGQWLGLEALAAGMRARDGRGPRTALASAVPARLGLRTPRAVMEAIYTGRMAEDRLMELAPVVFAVAKDGDDVAGGLIDRQADEVVAMAGAAIGRLRLGALDVDVVLGGGIFRSMDERLLDGIARGLSAVAPAAVARVLDAPPVLGAALLGLDRSAADRPRTASSSSSSAAAIRRARAALTHDRMWREGPWPGSSSNM
jgi:N-acetylglucosamine kinase-like BadF-type ATPase